MINKINWNFWGVSALARLSWKKSTQFFTYYHHHCLIPCWVRPASFQAQAQTRTEMWLSGSCCEHNLTLIEIELFFFLSLFMVIWTDYKWHDWWSIYCSVDGHFCASFEENDVELCQISLDDRTYWCLIAVLNIYRYTGRFWPTKKNHYKGFYHRKMWSICFGQDSIMTHLSTNSFLYQDKKDQITHKSILFRIWNISCYICVVVLKHQLKWLRSFMYK